MSLRPLRARSALKSFPRVSGDEPIDVLMADILAQFSPRERG